MEKLIFVSIPRNASRSVHAAFNGEFVKYNHLTASRIRVQEPNAKLFAVVREPISRISSWFYWHKINHPDIKQYQYPNIDAWVAAGIPHHWVDTPHLKNIDPLSQEGYIRNPETGESEVDHLIRFENMPAELNSLRKKYNLPPVELTHIGAIKKENLNPQSVEKITQHFKPEWDYITNILRTTT